MEPWQMTVREFVGKWPVDDSDLAEKDRRLGVEIAEGAANWTRWSMRRCPSAPGFWLADIEGEDEDVALVHHDARENEWDLVGGYVGPSLWIEPGPARGLGLSAELVLAKAVACGGRPHPESYTTLGRLAHFSGHRLSVQRALRDGFRVPAHVLADYEDLTVTA